MICVGGACIQNKAHNVSITSKTLSIIFQKHPGCPLVTSNHWIVSDNLAYLPAYNAHLKFWIHCEKKNKKKKEKTSGNRKENSFCSSSCFTVGIYI